jgi:hypothetical protein
MKRVAAMIVFAAWATPSRQIHDLVSRSELL